ncbi:GntR family transcriptional regulator/MocR family aminotransferase [Micromonospora pisi]|uniref:GntR family transcriptional regulator/MocR family aminotransferase n=1 Tax=Micromonospora pisi TaxID=589240 RepID=A0A495JMM5_9ACTN|nr:PLP-dependent aminotransferase family protein [Micromonospora pisi]RKR90227.1 GntR family transcriptional regulator/MocR family aminotransferase [Micromonospora pisi]
MTALETLVELDRGRPGLADQLTVALREAIVQGRLVPGTRLPSSRNLAADLRLSRGVVVEAYEQLVAEGRLVARPGSGTVVAPTSAPTGGSAGPAADGGPTEWASGHGWTGVRTTVAPSGLRSGVPDLAMFPRALWRRAYERALHQARDADLDYGDPAGAPRLRRELAGYLGRVRAARVDPTDLVVTTGAAQAVSLIAAALRARAATEIGIEEPGSAGIREHLLAQGLRLVPVPVDAEGLDVAALGRTRLPAVLTTPAHQYPTGVVLAPRRRAALLDWARRTGGLVVEDDYDAEFRYDRDPVGCLQGLAPDLVAHIGSASKALAPAMRLGWLAVPPSWRAEVAAAKSAADIGGPVLEQLAFAELLASGGYDRHLRRSRQAHRTRRDALTAALRRYLPTARISGVAAGLHLVVELPDGVDDERLGRAAQRVGLAPVPLSRLRLTRHGPPGLVLGYAANTPAELTRAVRVLASLIAPPPEPVPTPESVPSPSGPDRSR